MFDLSTVPACTGAEIAEYETNFQRQLHFRFDQKHRKRTTVEDGRKLRSQVDIDFERNDSAYKVRTSSFKELSRYILEDLLTVQEGDTPMLLCISKDLDGAFKNYLSDAAEQQKLDGIGRLQDIRLDVLFSQGCCGPGALTP